MTSTPFDYARWLQDLTARSLADQQRAAERYTDLMQRVAHGELSEPEVREAYLSFASEAGARYASDLAQLTLGYYTALLDLGRAYNEHFYERVLRGQPHPAQAGNGQAASPPRQVQLDLRGAVGQEAVAGFVIENTHSHRAEISFLFSDFVDVASGRPFRPLLQLQPAQLSLGPDEEAEVRLRLPLASDQFAAGRQYRSKIVVHGYDALELLLNVMVDPASEPATRIAVAHTSPTAAPPAEQPAPPKPAKAAKSTRAKKTPRRRTPPRAK
jgi:hypothetical protein